MGMVGGNRTYDGPGLAQWAPWKCPACAAENTGSIDEGCASCGSGSVKAKHVGVQAPAPQPLVTVDTTPLARDPRMQLVVVAADWERQHEDATLAAAFMAGYYLAQQHAQAQTMTAPPVTADLPALAPGGKVRRTISAALELFADQVLRDARDEILSGEWCSVEEAQQVIANLKQEEERENG